MWLASLSYNVRAPKWLSARSLSRADGQPPIGNGEPNACRQRLIARGMDGVSRPAADQSGTSTKPRHNNISGYFYTPSSSSAPLLSSFVQCAYYTFAVSIDVLDSLVYSSLWRSSSISKECKKEIIVAPKRLGLVGRAILLIKSNSVRFRIRCDAMR